MLYVIQLYHNFNNPVYNVCHFESPNPDHHFVSLQNKAADTFSIFGSDIYKHGKTASFKLAASESKSDGKTDCNPSQPCSNK